MVEEEEERRNFNPADYIDQINDTADVEVFYQTRMDLIRGKLKFKGDHLSFEALSRKNLGK